MSDQARTLSGQDLCNPVGGLLVGTVGNVQTALCLVVRALLASREFHTLRQQGRTAIAERLRALMAAHPPVPFVPRRAVDAINVGGVHIEENGDCILALRPSTDSGCPFGHPSGAAPAHPCLGVEFIEPLLREILGRVLALPDVEQVLDPLDGEPVQPERLWGFGCMRYPLRYRRDKVRVQQPLIVVMPVRAPVAENAERLRRIIRAAAPRIEYLLADSGIVHVAWFEFMEHDTQLALRTVYDGDFDTYIQHFALTAGELFDQLFSCIEGGPPMPVAEHPNEFVETIRRFNRSPLGGYFYCAYPQQPVARIPGEPAVRTDVRRSCCGPRMPRRWCISCCRCGPAPTAASAATTNRSSAAARRARRCRPSCTRCR
ncbi:hypothetical protein HK414_27850 [Ramlibacter terrae]|uniref:Uncharacterized protein n=1 Tax=Ramlibacter terrae TaxID=2732511 RepID=A0ABX6P6F6_9BURK|nr:hypothetical protein HK414_27850 [Ramlibacter terrae]